MAKVRSRFAVSESRFQARRRRRRNIRIAIVVAVFLFILGGIVGLAHASLLRINTITVAGDGGEVATSTLESFAAHEVAGSYYFLFPKNNIFLYPKRKITADVLASFPSIKSAKVAADTFSKISLTVGGRQPAAVWCGEAPDASAPCDLMDADGVVYAPAPQFSSPVYTAYYGQTDGVGLPKQFLTPQEFHSLSALAAAIAQKTIGEQLSSVSITADGDVHENFSDGFYIIYAKDEDSAQVFNNFALALQSAPFTSHSFSNFEYLDLRFGEKLYYKLKGTQ